MAECALIYPPPPPPPFSIGAPFHVYLTGPEDFEHIEPKSSVKSVAADQIKCACQNYWGTPPHARHCLKLLQATQKGIEEEPRSHLGMELVFSRTE